MTSRAISGDVIGSRPALPYRNVCTPPSCACSYSTHGHFCILPPLSDIFTLAPPPAKKALPSSAWEGRTQDGRREGGGITPRRAAYALARSQPLLSSSFLPTNSTLHHLAAHAALAEGIYSWVDR